MKTTKELARELGLLRRRSIAGTREKKRTDDLTCHGFKYLIVIDFESTCWKEGKFRTQEIIEFPAVLLNTCTGEIESEFHHYVQPQEQPTLSSFCTELTGITQDKVDNGIPLNLCLRRFRYWLEKLHNERGVICTGSSMVKGKQEDCNATCVTWSDWDLGVCLQYECKRKQLLKPAELTSWIDLRATYRKFYQRKPNGLNGALQDLGINFQGREHSGVDDARNTAKLAYRLIQDGCQLKVTKTIKTHERSSSCSPNIGSYFKTDSTSSAQNTGIKTDQIRSMPIREQTVNRSTKEQSVNQSTKEQTPNHSTKEQMQNHLKSSKEQCQNQSDKGHQRLINAAPVKNLSNMEQSPNKSNNRSPSKIPVPIAKTKTTSNVKETTTCNGQFNNIDKINTVGAVCKVQDQVTCNKVLNDENKPSTPNKVKLSGKRKEITPLKVKGNDRAVNSPLRKAPRQFTPKKFSAKDIYVDKSLNDTSGVTKGIHTKPKLGLQEHDMNIQQEGEESRDVNNPKSLTFKQTFSNSSSVLVFKKPNPVSEKRIGPVGPILFPQSGFGSPNTETPSTTCKSFSSSTPASNVTNKPFNQGPIVSPIHGTNQFLPNGSKSAGNGNTPAASFHANTSTPMCSSLNGFKTPNNTFFNNQSKTTNRSSHSLSNSNNQSSFFNGSNSSSMKMTPPLCRCGRRSKRKMVQSPGQNMGRFFFSCAVRKGAWSKEGCDFFKWEVASGSRQSFSTSNNNSGYTQQYTPMMSNQRKSLGVRPALKTPMCIR